MDGSPDSDTDPDALPEARRKAPWTQQFRQVVLVVLGAASFALFLVFMFMKARGAPIEYTDIFLVLATSGTLLGINFSLDLLAALADAADRDNTTESQSRRERP